MYKKFTFILTIIVIILVVVIVALTFKLNEYKKQENNIVNLENLSEDLVTKKENTMIINSEYISDTTVSMQNTNVEKSFSKDLMSEYLLNTELSIISDTAIYVVPTYLMDFHNGILIEFGDSGNEAILYLNNRREDVIELPDGLLDEIRGEFNSDLYNVVIDNTVPNLDDNMNLVTNMVELD